MQLKMFDTASSQPLRNIDQMVTNLESTIARISGLKYIPDFINEKEHEELWQAIYKEPWLTDLKRRVQHYGWKYDYKSRSIDYSMFLGELPSWAKPIANRLYNSGYLPNMPDQLIINEYQPGQGITNHVDCEPCFGSTIITISLGSKCVMDFINIKTKEKIEVLLEPRSLAVLSEEARYNWSHGIAARKIDKFRNVKTDRQLRISMTFRNVILKNTNE
jgi:alkylated DNA repair dioxygenase AlkB